jgi:hypothetical protein
MWLMSDRPVHDRVGTGAKEWRMEARVSSGLQPVNIVPTVILFARGMHAVCLGLSADSLVR